MKRISLKTLSFVVLGGVVLAGCGGNDSLEGDSGADSTASGSNGNTVIDIALWDEEVSDVIDMSVQEFEDNNPGVQVNVTYTPWSDYWTRTRTSLAGGSGPDLFWLNASNFEQYVASGFIKDLEPFIEEDDFDTNVYAPSLLDLYSYEEQLHGLPHFQDSIALFYNKQMFDDAGLEYPDETWTWEDVEEKGRELTNEENRIYGYVAQVKGQEGFYNLVHQAGGYIINEEKTLSGHNNPEAIEAFNWMQQLMDEGISPSAQQQIETEPEQIFGSRQAAMIPLISVNVPAAFEMIGEDLGIAPLPQHKERASVVHGITWAMNENTEEEELAWELMKTLTNEQANLNIAESGFSMPAYEGTEEDWLESIPEVDLQVFIDALDYGIPSPVSRNSAEWQDVEITELQDAFLGRQTIEEATNTIEEEMNVILENE